MTAALGLRLFTNGVEADLGVARHSREAGGWLLKERFLGARSKASKSWAICVRARSDLVEAWNHPRR